MFVTAHHLALDKVHEEAQAVVHGEEVEQSFRGHVFCLRTVDRLTMPEYVLRMRTASITHNQISHCSSDDSHS